MVYLLFVLVLQPSSSIVVGLWTHSCMSKVHLINIAFCSFISTHFGPIFLDVVFPFKWSTRELIGIFHDLQGLLWECVPLSITSIVTFDTSLVHMPLLVFEGIQFGCGVDLLFCGWKTRGRFSLLAARFVASFPMWDYQVHDCLSLPSPSF